MKIALILVWLKIERPGQHDISELDKIEFLSYFWGSETGFPYLGITAPKHENCSNFDFVDDRKALDYLKYREKEKKDSVPVVSFLSLEAVLFMHYIILSKEQMRQVRYFFGQKCI